MSKYLCPDCGKYFKSPLKVLDHSRKGKGQGPDVAEFVKDIYPQKELDGLFSVRRKDGVILIDDLDEKSAKYICKCINNFAQLQKQVEAERWIPVGERLPEEKLEILFIFMNHVYKGEYGDDSRLWYNPKDITHWKPIILPEQALQDGKEKE